MIEFDGAMLVVPEADAASHLLTLIAAPSEGVIFGIGSDLLSGPGEGSVLQDIPSDAGDGWIMSLLSTVSSDAVAADMIVPADDDLPDRLATESEEDDIVITGRRTGPDLDYWDSGGGEGGSSGSGGTGGGGGTGGIGGTPVEEHTQDCGTEDGAAVQVANHVMGLLPPDVSGPEDPLTTSTGNDWTKVEFGALIVKNPNGSFGAFNDTIYSNDKAAYVLVPFNSTQPIQGFWHTHPAGSDSLGRQAINRYPSSFDWSALSQIAGRPSSVSDPSVWVTGPDGITREFKLSERSYFENLAKNESRMENGEGLEGRVRSQSCG